MRLDRHCRQVPDRRVRLGALAFEDRSERGGLASGINNTFRQLGIAVGIAGLGAIFTHHAANTTDPVAGIVAGLDAVLAVAATITLAAAIVCRPLLGRQRSTPGSAPAQHE